MSVRRCAQRGLSWSRHVHHLATTRQLRSSHRLAFDYHIGSARDQRFPSSIFASRNSLAVPSLIYGRPQCLLIERSPGGLILKRLNHDETSNLGTQVTIDITNKPSSADDEDDGDETLENIYVTSFSPTGLRLSNKFAVIGPCILFPRTVLSWNVASAKDISPESLTLFSLLEPRLDVLVIGIGDGSVRPPDTQSIITYCKRLGINVEILNTEEACSTFNFLNGERRHVAAAIIPPRDVSLFTPEYFLHEELSKPDDIMNQAMPVDASNPKNWYLNPEGVYEDERYDRDMSRQRREVTSRRDAAEMRHTENLIREEMEAMEDRFTPHGEKITTELDEQARAEIEKDLLEYERTGEISMRLEFHLKTKDAPTRHVDDFAPGFEGLEQYREITWHGLDKSQRFRKKFDNLYDVGQGKMDPVEEGRQLAEEKKLNLLGEDNDEGEKIKLMEGEDEKLLEGGNVDKVSDKNVVEGDVRGGK